MSVEKQRRDERQTVKQVHRVEKEGASTADQMYTLPIDGLEMVCSSVSLMWGKKTV